MAEWLTCLQILYAGEILYVLVISLVKASILVFYVSISQFPNLELVTHFVSFVSSRQRGSGMQAWP